jgi:hypothetical protein
MQTRNSTAIVRIFRLNLIDISLDFSRIKVAKVGSTELSTIFVDDSSQLWSFPNSEIEKEKIYATQIELNSCPYSVRQFVTGRLVID